MNKGMNSETMARFEKCIAAYAGINTEKDWSEMVLTLANGEQVVYGGGGVWYKYPLVPLGDGSYEPALEVNAESITHVIWKRALEAGKVEKLDVNEVNQATGQQEVHPSPVKLNPFADGTVGGQQEPEAEGQGS